MVSLKSLVSQTCIGTILVFDGIQKSKYIWKLHIIIDGGHFWNSKWLQNHVNYYYINGIIEIYGVTTIYIGTILFF